MVASNILITSGKENIIHKIVTAISVVLEKSGKVVFLEISELNTYIIHSDKYICRLFKQMYFIEDQYSITEISLSYVLFKYKIKLQFSSKFLEVMNRHFLANDILNYEFLYDVSSEYIILKNIASDLTDNSGHCFNVYINKLYNKMKRMNALPFYFIGKLPSKKTLSKIVYFKTKSIFTNCDKKPLCDAYDIDGVFGAASFTEISAIINVDISITLGCVSKTKIHNKSFYILKGDKFSTLHNNFSCRRLGFCKFGETDMNIFLCFNHILSKNENEIFDLKISHFLDTFISVLPYADICGSSHTEYGYLFKNKNRFTLKKNLFNLFFEKLSLLVKSNGLGGFCYIEAFGMKTYSVKKVYCEVIESICVIVDLSIWNSFFLDICYSICPTTATQTSIFLKKDYIKHVRAYNVLHLHDTYNYNEKSVLLYKGDKLVYRLQGVSKINFYNTLVYNTISKQLRKHRFPKYTFEHIKNLLTNHSVSGKTLLKNINESINNLAETKKTSFGLRFELSCHATSIISAFEKISEQNSNNFTSVETISVFERLSNSIKILRNVFSCGVVTNLRDIFKIYLTETIVICMIIKGDKNTQSLPLRITENFKMLRDLNNHDLHNMISKIIAAKVELEALDIIESITKLILACNSEKNDTRGHLIKIIRISNMRDKYLAAKMLFDMYLDDFKLLYKRSKNTNFYIYSSNVTAVDKCIDFEVYFKELINMRSSKNQRAKLMFLGASRLLIEFCYSGLENMITFLIRVFKEYGVKYLYKYEASRKVPELFIFTGNKIVKFYDMKSALEEIKLEVSGKYQRIKRMVWDYNMAVRFIAGHDYYSDKPNSIIQAILNDIRFEFTFTHKDTQLYDFAKRVKKYKSGEAMNDELIRNALTTFRNYSFNTYTVTNLQEFLLINCNVVLSYKSLKEAKIIIQTLNHVSSINSKFDIYNTLCELAEPLNDEYMPEDTCRISNISEVTNIIDDNLDINYAPENTEPTVNTLNIECSDDKFIMNEKLGSIISEIIRKVNYSKKLSFRELIRLYSNKNGIKKSDITAIIKYIDENTILKADYETKTLNSLSNLEQ